VEESAEEVASPHLRRASGRCGRRIHSVLVIRRSQFEGAVWALLVEAADVDAEDVFDSTHPTPSPTARRPAARS
jgi:hypothetical protein